MFYISCIRLCIFGTRRREKLVKLRRKGLYPNRDKNHKSRSSSNHRLSFLRRPIRQNAQKTIVHPNRRKSRIEAQLKPLPNHVENGPFESCFGHLQGGVHDPAILGNLQRPLPMQQEKIRNLSPARTGDNWSPQQDKVKNRRLAQTIAKTHRKRID